MIPGERGSGIVRSIHACRGRTQPATVAAATSLMFNAANTAANMYCAGAVGAAGLIHSFGNDYLKKAYLEKRRPNFRKFPRLP